MIIGAIKKNPHLSIITTLMVRNQCLTAEQQHENLPITDTQSLNVCILAVMFPRALQHCRAENPPVDKQFQKEAIDAYRNMQT